MLLAKTARENTMTRKIEIEKERIDYELKTINELIDNAINRGDFKTSCYYLSSEVESQLIENGYVVNRSNVTDIRGWEYPIIEISW